VANHHIQERRSTSAAASHVEDNYEAFLSRLSVKGRAAAERHDELCGELDGFGVLWKRLAGALGRLAPDAIEMVGGQSVKFHIPDGKYRLQVFALDDTRQGIIIVYLPNIVDQAIERHLLLPGGGNGNRMFKIAREEDDPIQLELITAETPDMTVCKAMVGWGRRALKISVSVQAKPKRVRTVELLCELAAEAWSSVVAAEKVNGS
jgi:hypothetical protein